MSVKRFNPNECKVQLKLAASRMQLQKNKKVNGIKNLKREIAQLLATGREEGARIKTEVIIREDFLIDAYEILELFCETLVTRISWLAAQEQCPLELKEAVSTIIYAASRVEIKELQLARLHLIAKFGKVFGEEATENTNNSVNPRIIHKLRIQPPENFLILQYMADIAKAHNVNWSADELLLRESAAAAAVVSSSPVLPLATSSPAPPSAGAGGPSIEPLPSELLPQTRTNTCPLCHGEVDSSGVTIYRNGVAPASSPHNSQWRGPGSGGGGGGGVLTGPPDKITAPGSVSEFERLFATIPGNQHQPQHQHQHQPQHHHQHQHQAPLPPATSSLSQPSSQSPATQPFPPQGYTTPMGIPPASTHSLPTPSAPPSQAILPPLQSTPTSSAEIAERFTGLAAPGGVPLNVFSSEFSQRFDGGDSDNNSTPATDPFSSFSNGIPLDGSVNPFTAASSDSHHPTSSPALGASIMADSIDLSTSAPTLDELSLRFEALKKQF